MHNFVELMSFEITSADIYISLMTNLFNVYINEQTLKQAKSTEKIPENVEEGIFWTLAEWFLCYPNDCPWL